MEKSIPSGTPTLRWKDRGHRYATNSDTETILHLYEEYGDACVDHFGECFALRLGRTQCKPVLCATDWELSRLLYGGGKPGLHLLPKSKPCLSSLTFSRASIGALCLNFRPGLYLFRAHNV